MSRPGKMDQRIKIKRESATGDGVGGDSVSLATLFEAWAHISPASGTETERFERLDGKASYIFTIRNRRDFTIQENDRIEWEGVDYNIRFIARPGGRKMYVEITAERGVAQ